MKTILSNSKGDKHYFLIRFRGTNHPGFQVSFMPRTLPRVSDRRTKTDCGIRTRNLGRFSTTCAQRETLQQKPDRIKSINFPPPSYCFLCETVRPDSGTGRVPSKSVATTSDNDREIFSPTTTTLRRNRVDSSTSTIDRVQEVNRSSVNGSEKSQSIWNKLESEVTSCESFPRPTSTPDTLNVCVCAFESG